jgi:hypothetical protein
MSRRLVFLALVFAGCATVRDAGAPLFGRAPQTTACELEVRRGPSPDFVEFGSVLIEGSVFLTPQDVERIARAEACAAGADAVLLSSEAYGVPFAGSQATATFLKARPVAPPP